MPPSLFNSKLGPLYAPGQVWCLHCKVHLTWVLQNTHYTVCIALAPTCTRSYFILEHTRAHPLALSQHVILMMRCGMPHYRHTQPCSYSTIDGPGAFFTSLDPPGVMLRHKVPAHHTTQQNTHSKMQHWLCCQVAQSTDTEYTQWRLMSNGKIIFCENPFSKNKITNNCQWIWRHIFHPSLSMCGTLCYFFCLTNSWFEFVWSIFQLGFPDFSWPPGNQEQRDCISSWYYLGASPNPEMVKASSTWDRQDTGRRQRADVENLIRY